MDAFTTPEAEVQEDIETASIMLRLRECQAELDETQARFRRDFRRIITGLLTIGIIACSFLFVGMPKAERMALIDQESLAWVK